MIYTRVISGAVPAVHISSTTPDAMALNLMISGEEAVRELRDACDKALEDAKTATHVTE